MTIEGVEKILGAGFEFRFIFHQVKMRMGTIDRYCKVRRPALRAGHDFPFTEAANGHRIISPCPLTSFGIVSV